MPHELFTQDWAVAWGEAIRASDDYRAAARHWQWPMVLTMTPDPKHDLPERSVFLDLFEGDCREARTAHSEDFDRAPYVISADPHTWKRVLDHDLEPIFGIMRGKLTLEKGHLTSLIPYVIAAKELVNSATHVPTQFPAGL